MLSKLVLEFADHLEPFRAFNEDRVYAPGNIHRTRQYEVGFILLDGRDLGTWAMETRTRYEKIVYAYEIMYGEVTWGDVSKFLRLLDIHAAHLGEMLRSALPLAPVRMESSSDLAGLIASFDGTEEAACEPSLDSDEKGASTQQMFTTDI